MHSRAKKPQSQFQTEKAIDFYENKLVKQKKLIGLDGGNTNMMPYKYFKGQVENEINPFSTLGEFLAETDRYDNHNPKMVLLYYLLNFILEVKKQVIDIEMFSQGIKNIMKFYGPQKWKKMVRVYFHQSCFYTDEDKSMLLQQIDNNDDKEPDTASTGRRNTREEFRKGYSSDEDSSDEDSSDDDAPSGLLMKSTARKRATECGVFLKEYSSDEEGKDAKSKTNVSGIEAELKKFAKIDLCEKDSPKQNIREDSNPGIDFASKIEAEISEDSSLDSEVSSKIEAEISEDANLDGGVPSETEAERFEIEENELTRDENMANIHRSQGFAHNSAVMASHNPHPHWSNNNPTAVAPHNPQAYARHPQYLAQNSQPFSMPPNSPMVAPNYNPAGFQGYNQRANVATRLAGATFGHNLAGRQGILLPVNPNAAWETICTITSSKKWPSPGEINAGLEQARVDTSHHAHWANTKRRYHDFKRYECTSTKVEIRVRKRKGDDGAFDGTFDIDTKGQVNFIQH